MTNVGFKPGSSGCAMDNGVARHDVRVATVSRHASLEPGIGRGELRRALRQRWPAGYDSANADQNGFRFDVHPSKTLSL
jgi:hypothetical protein